MREPTYPEMLAEWRDATGGDTLSIEAWAKLRKDLLMEEVREACEAIDHFVITGDARPMAKELADVEYVAEGAAQRPGINTYAAFLEVHRSNMTKIGPDGKALTRDDGKILKGSHYQEANMSVAFKPEDPSWLEAFLEWLEGTLRSIPTVARVLIVTFFAGSIGWMCLSVSYWLAGGR